MGHDVVVIGAGYAGLAAALRTARRGREAGVRVTLVNERDTFVERVRLHQRAAGGDPVDRPLAAVLAGTGVDLVIGRATAVDTAARRVRVAAASGGERGLGYDTLVYAPGSGADTASVPGAEHAATLAGRDAAGALAEDTLPRLAAAGGTVAVVGGGLTGIEAATEIAEAHPGLRVRMVTRGRVGGELSARGRRHVVRVLDRLGVDRVEGTGVAEVAADGVRLADGTHVAADAVIWNAGFTVPALAREAGLAVDADGRVLVDATQRSVSHPDVYAVGDAAAATGPDGRVLRMACATGLPMAAAAARAIAARAAGRPAKDLEFRYYIRCVSLGRRDGLIQVVGPDDTPRDTVLTGRAAALVKEAVCRGAGNFAAGRLSLRAPARLPGTARTPVSTR
ncbi:NAD(P)/FAD-dependent oxidoreductase [Nocardiopsis trehalosi]|jgi:NADH dehydrogenase FAD-containing subunit|uniref:NAD(P)/FAD-dependent oxidoreductase n=1 Tax=Nocardiopsis trehalosi TaxID=109329 RepID=UPI000835AA0F|nr:FAD-dependent oxidoreductase [Nocardiopsis trehalosi]